MFSSAKRTEKYHLLFVLIRSRFFLLDIFFLVLSFVFVSMYVCWLLRASVFLFIFLCLILFYIASTLKSCKLETTHRNLKFRCFFFILFSIFHHYILSRIIMIIIITHFVFCTLHYNRFGHYITYISNRKLNYTSNSSNKQKKSII